MPEAASARRRDPTWVAAAVLITVAACVLIWLIAIVTLPPGPAFLFPAALAGSALCAVACVWLSPRPITLRSSLLPVVMGVLAGLAPVAVVLAFRLSMITCTVVNVFGLPWAEPWRSVAHVASASTWILSCIFLVAGLVLDRGLRRAAIAMLVWSAIAAVPAFLLLFITFYGDPSSGCLDS